MRHSLARSMVSLLLALQVSTSSVVFSQEVRQRRTQVEPQTASSQVTEWQPPPAQPITANTLRVVSQPEPTIRVALATNVRSATISTSGRLTNASNENATPVALEIARVRLEPRLLSPLPPADTLDNYRLQIVGLSARADAEQKLKEVRDAISEESTIVYDDDSRTWGLQIGSQRPQVEAEELRARLEDAGLNATTTPVREAMASSGSNTKQNETATATRTVRPAARYTLPTREVVASAPGSGRLFSSSAPVMIGSDSEITPVRFEDRPYRGRIEVFANTRGALTVVNVLGLEDYVKGVVPNELSAGGFPLLEAHKAQAIAARTYALRNRGQFMSQGYDLLPTTRSQVYRGLGSENSLSSRAVDETRGVIATYNGDPINALYTSTCGGRTEDAGNIFNEDVAYLKGRECAAEGQAALAPFIIRTSREAAELKEDQSVTFARDLALLVVQNFSVGKFKVTDSWLNDEVDVAEARSWLASAARIAHQVAPAVTEDVNLTPAFATALTLAVFGESRGGILLNAADVDYYLPLRDAADIPAANRADVAMLIRDGYLPLLPDGSVNALKRISRGRALHAIARLFEARNLLQLQKGTARPTAEGNLILRSTKGKDQAVKVNNEAFLFRQIGEALYPVRSIALVGGEPVVFHVNSAGEVDYLEVKPAPNGAAADRFSPFANWTTELSLGQAQGRLGRYAGGVGSLVDLRVVSRGRSKRAIDLEVVGTNGTRKVLGGRIRSALGLREQLFVIEKKYDENGRITGFIFLGRGWGHGVGMCQVGAYGLAKQGFRYDQILKAYYTDIELTKMY
jgi:stage II sporulation protein D